MRVITPNKDDGPDWKYPYNHRATIERLQDYFNKCKDNGGWKKQNWRETRALPIKIAAAIRKMENTNWPSVPPEHRQTIEEWYQNEIRRQTYLNGGYPLRPGKVRSIRMNAACRGRYILTGRYARRMFGYWVKRAIFTKYQNWETEQQRQAYLASLPPTEHKVLDIG